MYSNSSGMAICAAWAALLAPTLCAQTTATCNGLAATIVASAPGVINGTQGDDVIVGSSGADTILDSVATIPSAAAEGTIRSSVVSEQTA